MSARYECPRCGESDGLWQSVDVEATGWRNVDPLTLDGIGHVEDVEDNLASATPNGDMGCTCGWEGHRSDVPLVNRDRDGVVIPAPLRGQLELGEST